MEKKMSWKEEDEEMENERGILKKENK